jgi:hypothetical protein
MLNEIAPSQEKERNKRLLGKVGSYLQRAKSDLQN